jgi:hypothetical protein
MVMSSTSSEASIDYDAYLWRDLLNLIDHTYLHLDETGCFQKEDLMYYDNLRKTMWDLYNQSGEDKKMRAKTLAVDMLWKLVDALLGCG